MRRLGFFKLLGLLLSLVTCEVSNAQQPSDARPGRPIEGSTGGLYLPNQSQSSVQPDLHPSIRMHKDSRGKSCVTVAAYSRPKTDFRKIFGGHDTSASEQTDIKSKIYEHIISAQNRCGQTIKLKVCYYESQNCVSLDVPGYDRQEASLGVAPGMPGFRYQYTEQF
jgi:hypothetical protein